MKTMKKLIPALAMLLVSAVLLGTSTFAWFSMNNKVTVTGMSVNTKVDSNLLISPDTTEANFATSLTQTLAGRLEPVSTVTGTAFFYHDSVTVVASGAQSNNIFTAYSETDTIDAGWTDAIAAGSAAGKGNKYDAGFNTNYGNTVGSTSTEVCYGYVDYTFYLKAVSTSDNQKVSLVDCNLLYNDTVVTDKAWRVALLSTTGQTTATAASEQTPALVSILTLTGATNQTPGYAAQATSGALGSVSYGTAAEVDSDIDTGEKLYYKVIVRLWLEGEDTSCNNATYATLTDNYTLSLELKLSADTGITNITSVVPGP